MMSRGFRYFSDEMALVEMPKLDVLLRCALANLLLRILTFRHSMKQLS
jgi:hypothetical protein